MLTFLIALAVVTGPLAVILLTAGITLAIKENLTPKTVAQIPSPITHSFQNYQPYSWATGENSYNHLTQTYNRV